MVVAIVGSVGAVVVVGSVVGSGAPSSSHARAAVPVRSGCRRSRRPQGYGIPVTTELLTREAALELVLQHSRPLGTEEVSIGEAFGRVLGEDARAIVDLPPFPSSAMDG